MGVAERMRDVDIGGTSECMLEVLEMKPERPDGDVQRMDSKWNGRRMLRLV